MSARHIYSRLLIRTYHTAEILLVAKSWLCLKPDWSSVYISISIATAYAKPTIVVLCSKVLVQIFEFTVPVLTLTCHDQQEKCRNSD